MSIGACTCGGTSEVLETRPSTEGSIRRMRRCTRCGARWSTREVRVGDEYDHRAMRLVAVPRKMSPREALALVADLCGEPRGHAAVADVPEAAVTDAEPPA